MSDAVEAPSIARRLGLSDLPRGSALLLAALAVSNVSGYIFYVALSRLLTPERYGALGALVSVITIVAVPAAAIQTVIARRSATIGGSVTGRQIAELVQLALRGTAAFAALVCLCLLAAAPLVERFLHLGSVVPAAILAVYMLVALTAPVLRGAVHGLLHYGILALSLVIVTLVRLGLGIPLVAVGWDLTGAAVAFLAAEVCGLGPTVWALRPALAHRARRPPRTGLFAELRRACVVVACFSATTNLDVVQVRHYFPHRASGLYAAASLVGRAVLLASISLTMLVFPQFAQTGGRDARARSALRWALLGTAGIASAAVVVIAFAGAPMMRVVFGPEYGAAARVALVSAGSSALYSLCGLLMYFNLSSTSAASFAVVPAVIAQTIAIALFHASILQVAAVTLFVAAGLLALNAVWMAAER